MKELFFDLPRLFGGKSSLKVFYDFLDFVDLSLNPVIGILLDDFEFLVWLACFKISSFYVSSSYYFFIVASS